MRISVRCTPLSATALTTITLLLAGCAGSSGGGADGVQSAEGVSGSTISLGVVSDYTGPFGALATEALAGIEQYWDEQNADGGVCSSYDVELVVRDHQSNPQQAVTAYREITPQVAAYQNFAGSATLAAVTPDLEVDQRIVLANTAADEAVDSDYVLPLYAKFDVDGELSVRWLVESGVLSKGDTIASIYTESDYGQLEHEGAVRAAEDNGIEVEGYQVKLTDTDLSAAVNDALAAGADAVFAGVTPGQTASIATALEGAGADLPIAGAVAAYSGGLLDTPAGDYLTEHFTGTSYNVTGEFEGGVELYEKLTETNDGEPVSSDRANGYAAAALMHQLLEAACEAGDLTPEGIAAQRSDIGVTDFDGYAVDFDYSTPGESPATTAFIRKPDASVPGGSRTVSDGAFGPAD